MKTDHTLLSVAPRLDLKALAVIIVDVLSLAIFPTLLLLIVFAIIRAIILTLRDGRGDD
ncbi:hypothetical protein [Arachnia propionica]|uniref:hypothetical protein n=1 Tax=Arachnia propionica TaxID=1750 RepID=UPI001639C1C0|nr:hypothetical protein [Arachnia propionica]